MVFGVLKFVCAILISSIAAIIMAELLTKDGIFKRAKQRTTKTERNNLKNFNEEP